MSTFITEKCKNCGSLNLKQNNNKLICQNCNSDNTDPLNDKDLEELSKSLRTISLYDSLNPEFKQLVAKNIILDQKESLEDEDDELWKDFEKELEQIMMEKKPKRNRRWAQKIQQRQQMKKEDDELSAGLGNLNID